MLPAAGELCELRYCGVREPDDERSDVRLCSDFSVGGFRDDELDRALSLSGSVLVLGGGL